MSDLAKILELAQPLTRDADTPEREAIAGLFPRGYLSILAAPAGTGKTWLMQYLACQVSVGGNVLAGLRTRHSPMKCLIFAGETGRDLLLRRLKLTSWNCNPKLLRVYDAIELQRAGVNVMLNEDEGRATFLGILGAENPDLVFIDTLISFHSADESKQADMSGIYRFLLKTASACDCAIVANHHTRKRNNKNPAQVLGQDDVIGTSAGVRLSASVYIAEQDADPLGQADAEFPTVWVRNVKTWDVKVPPFSFTFYREQYGAHRLDFRITWGNTADSEERSARARLRRMLDDFDEGAVLTLDIVGSQLCVSQDNARKMLERAENYGDVERVNIPTGKGTGTAWKVLRNSRRG